MNKHKKKLLCIISFAVIVSISFACVKSVRADENFRVAKIKSFSGKVKIGKGGGEKTFDAIEGMSLVEGDSITTEKDSSALLYIDDDKEVKIGDNSMVNLSELSGYIGADEERTGISLWVGKIFSNIKKKLKLRSKYEIKVPTAVMGVRGTEFSVESLADGEIKVILLEGTVTAVRTSVDEAEKYTTFEVTITKDQTASMNQNDQSQSDITITGIKVNETSLFVLEVLKDFIERNPESLDENAKKEIYNEIEKRKTEQQVVSKNAGTDSDSGQPVIRMEPSVVANMALNNVMISANLNAPNMQPPNVLPEGVQGNQLFQANLFNAPAGQERPAPPPQPVMSPPAPTQQIMPPPAPAKPIPGQPPAPVQLPVQQGVMPPMPEQLPPQPIAEEPKPSSGHGGGGGATNSNVTQPVTAVNNPPSVQNSSVQIVYSTMASGIINASDVNGDKLSYVISTPAGHGTAIVNPETGKWGYIPAQQFIGTDSFVVTVSDGKGGSVASTVTVTVMQGGPPANSPPIAQDLNLTILEDTESNGQLTALGGDTNVTWTYSVAGYPTNGELVIGDNGGYRYIPNTDYNGIDSFKFKLTNGLVDSNEATVSITVTPVNDAPTVGDRSIQINDTTTTAAVSIDASDPDGDTLSYEIPTPAMYGDAVVDSTTGECEYTPSQQFNGTDSFVVTVSDGNGGSATSTVTVMQGGSPVNSPPIVGDRSIQINDTTTTAAVSIDASDQDGDTLSYEITTPAMYGDAVVDSTTGECEYTPSQQFNGTDSFVVTVSDVKGGSATSTITVVTDLQSLKSTLSNEISVSQVWTSQTVGTGIGECSSQQAIDDLEAAIINAQTIVSKSDATVAEINGAINTLKNAVEQVKNNIVNTLMVFTTSGDGSVTANSNFDQVITVQPNIGKFLNTLSSNDIILGEDFTGLTIKSISIPTANYNYKAEIELSGNLSKSTGVGTITIKAAGWESTVNSKDIMASIVVK